MFPIVSVAPPLECDQPLTAPPISTFRLGVPPSLRNAVTPPVLDPLSQLSQLMLAEPYPSPNPIQNPSRRCGYCARAAGATASARMPREATTHEVRMKVSVEQADVREFPADFAQDAGELPGRVMLLLRTELPNVQKLQDPFDTMFEAC